MNTSTTTAKPSVRFPAWFHYPSHGGIPAQRGVCGVFKKYSVTVQPEYGSRVFHGALWALDYGSAVAMMAQPVHYLSVQEVGHAQACPWEDAFLGFLAYPPAPKPQRQPGEVASEAHHITARLGQAHARLRFAVAALGVYSARADASIEGTDSLRKNCRAIAREIASLANGLVHSTLHPSNS